MFSWYARSKRCYAHLEDFQRIESLGQCRWFTRGWTLQEMIAPGKLDFYDRTWTFIAGRDSVTSLIAEATGVDERVLEPPASDWAGSREKTIKSALSNIPTCKKLSWASMRATTRVEDIAYCLMGIFSLNMPLLYGEGENAFMRLQQEIVKHSNDLTIFALEDRGNSACHAESCFHESGVPDGKLGSRAALLMSEVHGVFACWPSLFKFSSDLKAMSDSTANPEFSITNKGIRIMDRIAPYATQVDSPSKSMWGLMVPLNCIREQKNPRLLGVLLHQIGGDVYYRLRKAFLVELPTSIDPGQQILCTLFMAPSLALSFRTQLQDIYHGAFRVMQPPSLIMEKDVLPWRLHDGARDLFITRRFLHATGVALFGNRVKPFGFDAQFCAYFGYGEHEDPWVCLAGPSTTAQDLGIFPSHSYPFPDFVNGNGRIRSTNARLARIHQFHKTIVLVRSNDPDGNRISQQVLISARIERGHEDQQPIWEVHFDVEHLDKVPGLSSR